MTAPTKTTETSFVFAKNHLNKAKAATSGEINPDLKTALMNICWGLENLAIRLRAAYMSLERYKGKSVPKSSRARAGPGFQARTHRVALILIRHDLMYAPAVK